MNKRSSVYYYDFKTEGKGKNTFISKAKGIQFIEQTFDKGLADDVEFKTLVAADEDGHLKSLIQCSPHYALIKKIAELPDKIKVSDIAEIRQEAIELIK